MLLKANGFKGEQQIVIKRTEDGNSRILKGEPERTEPSLTLASRHIHAPAGRPPEWLFNLRKGTKRGTRLRFERDFLVLPRRVATTFTVAEAGPDYEKHVDGSVKDFARGADKRDPEWVKGHPFFTAKQDRISAAVVKNVCTSDAAMYRLMVNPYDGGRIMSRAFVRAYMGKVERAVGVRLFWIAAIHAKATKVNSENRHAHIIIRSTTFGPEVVRFTRPFILYGFRQIAADLIATMIGPMTDQERAVADRLSDELKRNRELKELSELGAPQWAIDYVLE